MRSLMFDSGLEAGVAAHHLDFRLRSRQIFGMRFELRMRIGEVQKHTVGDEIIGRSFPIGHSASERFRFFPPAGPCVLDEMVYAKNPLKLNGGWGPRASGGTRNGEDQT